MKLTLGSLILFWLLSISCNPFTYRPSHPAFEWDPHLSVLAAEALSEIDNNGGCVPIKRLQGLQQLLYGYTDGNVLGYTLEGEGWSTVTIKPDLAPDLEREVVLHELGHALWDFDHSGDINNVMYPYLVAEPDSIYHEQVRMFVEDILRKYYCEPKVL